MLLDARTDVQICRALFWRCLIAHRNRGGRYNCSRSNLKKMVVNSPSDFHRSQRRCGIVVPAPRHSKKFDAKAVQSRADQRQR